VYVYGARVLCLSCVCACEEELAKKMMRPLLRTFFSLGCSGVTR